MNSNLFLDTSGLFSYLVIQDDKHQNASAIVKKMVHHKYHLITTDYIIDEMATLLKARGYSKYLPNLFDGILFSKACQIEWMDQDYFHQTKAMMLKFQDHRWSFTDCFSFVVMKKKNLTQALSKDAHFREAGFRPLLVTN